MNKMSASWNILKKTLHNKNPSLPEGLKIGQLMCQFLAIIEFQQVSRYV